jgi:hypothetical protein
MMGQHDTGQGQLFYSFDLDEVVPADPLVRKIDGVLDLSWVRQELAPYYSATGRPSIDPVLLIRMLVLGYVFAIRSERALCREVQVNLAYRWFCSLSIEDLIPDHSAFTRARALPRRPCLPPRVRACRDDMHVGRSRLWQGLRRGRKPDRGRRQQVPLDAGQ